MKIAVIGGGISGIYCAHKLSPENDVTLYEANGYLGGHTDTHCIHVNENVCSVDTGFIVFNEQNYPLFQAFLNELGVKSQASNMSFSVSDQCNGIEYNAGSISGLFCQRSNLVRPRFYRMLFDILRFYKRCPELLEQNDEEITLGDYLETGGYGGQFIKNHLIPMASALWSSPPSTVSNFPARYFVSFMHNHRMLQVSGRPLWRTVIGGSSQYVKAFEKRYKGHVRVNSRVQKVARTQDGVMVHSGVNRERYDKIVIACHSDQSLNLLSDETDRERALLGAIRYQENDVLLHTDTKVMPVNRKAWASWNVIKLGVAEEEYVVTYYMNMLQNIGVPIPLLVSLNASDCIDREKVLLRRRYHHPVYTPDSLRAQKELNEANGLQHTYFAGAYLGWGFHEDGVRSGQSVVDMIAEESLARAA